MIDIAYTAFQEKTTRGRWMSFIYDMYRNQEFSNDSIATLNLKLVELVNMLDRKLYL